MAINSKRAKVDQEAINKIIDGGGSVPNPKEEVDESIEEKDIRFTITMPYPLASVIDRLRKPSKTSRQAWLMQAALEKLKKDGEI